MAECQNIEIPLFRVSKAFEQALRKGIEIFKTSAETALFGILTCGGSIEQITKINSYHQFPDEIPGKGQVSILLRK